MVTWYICFLLLLAGERVVELTISRRNAARALSRGAKEYGRSHFGWMVVVHSSFLIACAAEVIFLDRPFVPALAFPMLAVALGAQALRYWAISTLGPYWNVRVIVVPQARAVTAGPYRYVRHPNYLAVIAEGIAVPLLHSAWWTALGFSVLNAFLLGVRIRCEEQALATHTAYEESFRGRPRLVPRLLRGGLHIFRS